MKRTIILTEEQIVKMKELYEQGYNSKHIGKKLDIDHWIVRNRLKDIGIIYDRKNTVRIKPSQEELAEIKKLYDQGVSYDKIGKHLKHNEMVISRIIEKDLGLPKRKFRPLPENRPKRVFLFTSKELEKIKISYNITNSSKNIDTKNIRVFDEQELHQIHKLFDDGYGITNISKLFETDRNKIKKTFDKLGITEKDIKLKQLEMENYSILERECRTCNVIKSIDNFAKQKQMEEKREEYNYHCKDCVNKISRGYNETPKEMAAIRKKNRLSSPFYKLRKTVGRAIIYYLKESNSSKEGKSCLDYLPYTIKQLKLHIENLFSHPDNLTADGRVWMNWSNWGAYNKIAWKDNDPTTWVWSLDHIIPQANLPYTSMEDENFKKSWALSNLRPYSAKQNIKDGLSKVRHKETQ